jgi:hypothetical protein
MLILLGYVTDALEFVKLVMVNINVLLVLLGLYIVDIAIVHVLQEHLHHSQTRLVNLACLLACSVLLLQTIAKDVSLTCMHIEVNVLLHVQMGHLNLDKIVNHANFHV